jgi:hypothetical protein
VSEVGFGLIDQLDQIIGLETVEEVIPPHYSSCSHKLMTTGNNLETALN